MFNFFTYFLFDMCTIKRLYLDEYNNDVYYIAGR